MRIMAKMTHGNELPWSERFMVECSGEELLRIIGFECFTRQSGDGMPMPFKIGDDVQVSQIFEKMKGIRGAVDDLERAAESFESLARMARDEKPLFIRLAADDPGDGKTDPKNNPFHAAPLGSAMPPQSVGTSSHDPTPAPAPGADPSDDMPF